MEVTQNQAVLRLLKKKKSKGITAIDALEQIGCFRLAARIYDLRMQGYPIETIIFQDHLGAPRFARYYINE